MIKGWMYILEKKKKKKSENNLSKERVDKEYTTSRSSKPRKGRILQQRI